MSKKSVVSLPSNLTKDKSKLNKASKNTVALKVEGSPSKTAFELDSILDSALDEFEAQELDKKSKIDDSKPFEQRGIKDDNAEEELRKQELLKMMGSLQDKSYGPVLQNTLRALSTTNEGNETVESLFDQLQQQFGADYQPGYLPKGPDDSEGIENADRTIASTLQMLATAQQGMEGFEASKLEDVGEQMMEDMVAQFENLGEREDYNEVIDGVMRQLLSKDLMYEPTKMICSKFPEWLALHRSSLEVTEYTNYGKMYQSFQKLLAVYDTEPDNFPRLMELMYDMQQYGQPPAEIIKDLAPGLRFDENGMPIMPNMGAGMMPGAGGEGFPDMTEMASRMGTDQCVIS